MKTITLNSQVIEKSGISVSEVITLLTLVNHIDIPASLMQLQTKGLISPSYTTIADRVVQSGYFVTNKGCTLLETVLLDSDRLTGSPIITDRIDTLVAQLQAFFPKGKKDGTTFYWRGNKPDIRRKLQSFFKRYGDIYSDTQILKATEEYVHSFNGDYRYMRLLQYFIWKDDIKGGIRVSVSELASYIENAGQEDNNNSDWTKTLL